MRASFLDDVPISGVHPERSYEPTGECGWVLFEPGPARAWLGAFGLGDFGCRTVLRFGSTENFLVVADGRSYVVNASSGELVYKPTEREITAALAAPDRDLIIGCDQTAVFTMASRSLVWSSPEVALDGIDLLKVSSKEVLGRFHTDEGIFRFTLRFDDWQLLQGEPVEVW